MKLTWETVAGVLLPFLKMALILGIGHFVIVYAVKIIKKALDKGKLDKSFKAFLIKTLRITMYVFVILSALSAIGISTTGILAALSAAAVAIAVGLKDSLANVAGGILLLISPRFQTGDFIEAGSDSGKVISVDLLHTTIKTVDNKQISIPNGVLINSHIINYSSEPQRRVDITFPIPYETDAKKAVEIIKRTVSAHPQVMNEPDEPFVKVNSYGDSAVNIITRVWCASENYWTVYFDLTQEVRDALEAEGIFFPYNQLDINIKQGK